MIYLDYAAHAPADPAVLERFCDMERRFPANPNSVHAAGKAAREEMARVTEQIAALTGASPAEVIFTSGATEANNLAIKGIAQASRHIGKEKELRSHGEKNCKYNDRTPLEQHPL